MKKSNGGLQESAPMMADFTDDESSASGSRGVTPAIPDEADRRAGPGTDPATYPEAVFYDMPTITDDESDSDVGRVEEEEPKKAKKNGGLTNLRGKQYATRNTSETEKKSSERRSVKKNVNKKTTTTRTRSSRKADGDGSRIGKISDESAEPSSGKQSRGDASSSKDQRSQAESGSLMESATTPEVRLPHLVLDRLSKEVMKTHSPSSSAQRSRAISSSEDSPQKDAASNEEARPQEAELSATKGGRGRLRRSTSVTSDVSEVTESAARSLRARRANSVTKSTEKRQPPTRGRRASSLAKDVLMMNAAINADDVKPAVSPSRELRASTPYSPRRSLRRTAALRSETNDSESPVEDKQLPVRRSTRLTSAKRERQADDASMDRAKSESDDGESNARPSLRARTSSVSSDTEMLIGRSLRSSARRTGDEEEAETRMRRRRGGSLPKEIVARTGRKRKSSVTSIPEEVELPDEPMTLRSSRVTITDQPAINTRGRSASLLSIPEELENILSPRETRSSSKNSQSRERRAVSVDVSDQEVKKRVGRTKIARARTIATEPIAEECAENNEADLERAASATVTLGDDEAKSETGRNAKSAIAETAKVAKKRGRSRKVSASQESSNIFSFSQPDKMDDSPLDKKEK